MSIAAAIAQTTAMLAATMTTSKFGRKAREPAAHALLALGTIEHVFSHSDSNLFGNKQSCLSWDVLSISPLLPHKKRL